MLENKFGYVVRVETKGVDSWLGQRVYMRHESAIVVKHNKMAQACYSRVYVLPATEEQLRTALSIVE